MLQLASESVNDKVCDKKDFFIAAGVGLTGVPQITITALR